MKKCFFAAVLLICVSSAAVFAEVKAGPDWSGMIDTEFVYIDNYDQDGDTGDAMNFQTLYTLLDVDVQLVDNVEIHGSLKLEQTGGAGPWGPATFPSGEAVPDVLMVRSAKIVFNEFLMKQLTLSVGRIVDQFALDAERGSLMLDTEELTASEGADGFKLNFKLDNLDSDLFMYTYQESTPGTTAFGRIGGDSLVAGLHASYLVNNDESKKIYGLILLDMRGGPSGAATGNNMTATSIMTLNIGADWEIKEGFSIYGQYAQALLGEHWVDGNTDGDIDDDERQDASGSAFQFGITYQLASYELWLQYDMKSGDDDMGDDDYTAWTAPGESQALLLMAESVHYGYNRNSNVTAIRLGCTASFGSSLEAEAAIGMYETVEDEGTALGAGIGNEIDLGVNWFYTDSVFFSGKLALFLPHKDYTDNVAGFTEDDMVMALVARVGAAF